jgi:hypothetical protein
MILEPQSRWMTSRVCTVFALSISLSASACEKKQFSVSIHEDARMTALVPGESVHRFKTILKFQFASGTETAFGLPDGDPIEFEIALSKTDLDGRSMSLKLSPAPGFSVEPSGRRGRWATKMSGAWIEVEAVAELPAREPKPRCGAHLPVAIDGSWKLIYGGSWKIDGPTHGKLSPVVPIEAFVDCGPSMPIVLDKDGEPLAQ